MKNGAFGILQKKILANLARYGIQNKNEIRKGVKANYKNVYYAVENLINRQLVTEIHSSYGLSFQGLDTILRLQISSKKESYMIMKKNKIIIPTLVKNGVLPILNMANFFIDIQDSNRIQELTKIFIENYPEEYFDKLLSLSRDKPIGNRVYTATISLVLEQILTKKFAIKEISNIMEQIVTQEGRSLAVRDKSNY